MSAVAVRLDPGVDAALKSFLAKEIELHRECSCGEHCCVKCGVRLPCDALQAMRVYVASRREYL